MFQFSKIFVIKETGIHLWNEYSRDACRKLIISSLKEREKTCVTEGCISVEASTEKDDLTMDWNSSGN